GVAPGVRVACIDRLGQRRGSSVARSPVRACGESFELRQLDDVRTVQTDAIFAVFLGPVERAVGEPNELVASMSLHGEGRKTRADGVVTAVIEIELIDPVAPGAGGC